MRTIGIPFNIIESVDSTNRIAMEQGMSGDAASGSVFFALEQTAGKGQRGRTWASQTGMNIMMSILLQPELAHADMFRLSWVAALAATDLFGRYAGGETMIKWPNDIYWRDRKAGGILIENKFRGAQWQWSVLGFGININQTVFDPALPNPVSLRQISGKTYNPVELAKELCSDFQQRLDELNAHHFQALQKAYEDRMYGRQRRFRFKHRELIFTAMVQGIDEGRLLVTEDGSSRTYNSGELAWLGPV